MKRFEAFFSKKEIISYICKLRANVAHSRSKKHLLHLLTDSNKYNYHLNNVQTANEDGDQNEFNNYEQQFLNELARILPGRKKWVVLGPSSRTNKRTNQPMSAFDRNYHSLIKTIKLYQKKPVKEPWLIELENFIHDIQTTVSCKSYKVTPPAIYPKLKKKKRRYGANVCRPICMFLLKDRVILRLTNKYFTNLFDKYFEDCSYAFRARRGDAEYAILSHHDCVNDLSEYRKKIQGSPLWVAECDIEKFYDSVNHEVVKSLFVRLIEKAKNDYDGLDFEKPSHIFFQYLDCYAFNVNVLPKVSKEYWSGFKIPNGEFEWIADRFEELKYYKSFENERIGVPQGGALSGLIANIVLDAADKRVLELGVFYVRFCDDMLIVHPERQLCERALQIYLQALAELKLVPHSFMKNEELILQGDKKIKTQSGISLLPFWKCKSKGPYKWDMVENGGFPWIGFVGYEIKSDGSLRVRKASLKKELRKQREVVNEIIKAVSKGLRKSMKSVTESAIHRLVGMSVGRVTIKNYDTVKSDLCWKNGFKELKMNRHTVQQVKLLDRNRNRMYSKLMSEMRSKEVEAKLIDSKPRQIIHFNKPFSYFYQVLERNIKD